MEGMAKGELLWSELAAVAGGAPDGTCKLSDKDRATYGPLADQLGLSSACEARRIARYEWGPAHAGENAALAGNLEFGVQPKNPGAPYNGTAPKGARVGG